MAIAPECLLPLQSMPFFGILWIAFWLNCSLSYGFQGSLISDYLSSAFKHKPLIKVSNPLGKITSQSLILARESVVSTPTSTVTTVIKPTLIPTDIPVANISPAKPLTTTSISSSLIFSSNPASNSAGTSTSDSAKGSSSGMKFASWWLKTGENNFCQAETTAMEYSWANLSTLEGNRELEIDTPSPERSKISLPPKIMQVLHSLFPWQNYFVSRPKPSSTDVVVARSDTLMPPQTRRNFWLLSQKIPDNVSTDAPQAPGQPIVSPIPKFQVWLKRHLIAEFEQKLDADLLAQRLQQLVNHPNLDPQQLQPSLVNGEPAIKLGDRLLFLVDDALKSSIPTNKELIAIKLTNSLRLALGVAALDLAQAQIKMYKLSATSNKISGLASWYGSYFHGRQTANGEIYDQHALTVAHPSLPFNTYLEVTNQKNNKSVIVRVNDRGPYIPPRVLDISNIAARCIESEDTGVVMVDAVIMQSFGESKPEKK